MNIKILIGLVSVVVLGGIIAIWAFSGADTAPDTTEQNPADISDLTQNPETEETVTIPDLVAVVNGTNITGAEFESLQTQIVAGQGIDPASLDAEAQLMLQSQVIDSLVSQVLLAQAAAEAAVEVPESDITAQLEQIKNQFEDESGYEQALLTEGMTEADLRAQIATDLAQEIYLEETLNLSSLTVDEAEIEATYTQVAAQQEVPPLEEVRGEVEQMVMQQKRQDAINQHLAELRETANVEIFM